MSLPHDDPSHDPLSPQDSQMSLAQFLHPGKEGPRVRDRRKQVFTLTKWLPSFTEGSRGFSCFLGITGPLGKAKERRPGEPHVELCCTVSAQSISVQKKEMCLSTIPCSQPQDLRGGVRRSLVASASSLGMLAPLDIKPEFKSPDFICKAFQELGSLATLP